MRATLTAALACLALAATPTHAQQRQTVRIEDANGRLLGRDVRTGSTVRHEAPNGRLLGRSVVQPNGAVRREDSNGRLLGVARPHPGRRRPPRTPGASRPGRRAWT